MLHREQVAGPDYYMSGFVDYVGVPRMTVITGSSNVEALAYEGSSLFIDFGGDTIYRYDQFSADDYDRLRAAKSLGSHFHKSIKGGGYPVSKIVKVKV